MSDFDMIEKIGILRKKRNAIILAHNYQRPEIQDIADFTGDSLELSIKAKNVKEDVIVFCGVSFMAETAKILSPSKTVLLPVADAGCPMADMIDIKSLRELKAAHPAAMVMCYVNSTAEIKAECDICCTSANAAKIASKIPRESEIIFVPDANLGAWSEKQSGRKMILYPGFCPTHVRFIPEMIIKKRSEYPSAALIVHPESSPDVSALADAVLSTGGMLEFARLMPYKEIIVGTETGLLHRLEKENPDKKFIALCEEAVCPNMKKTTLAKLMLSLENMEEEISVPEDIRQKAEIPVLKMLSYS
ncbi:MAG: quinolinate synthase [Lentisphaerae bacterium GWF2_45_14]|nr:MAG: quinolinate synthase [Lentisphaerae bacterium GWF2_45_14]